MIVQAADGTVEFRFYRPGVKSVALVGDFNAWKADQTFMRNAGSGWWSCCLSLLPGTYQFQYSSEGERFLDYAAFGLEHGPHGLNSVVHIDETAVSMPEARAAAETVEIPSEEVHLRLVPAGRRAAAANRVKPSVARSDSREPVAASA